MTGRIKSINYDRGYFFVTGDDDTDYFVHATALPDAQLIHELQRGDTLELVEIANTDKGWRANSVVPVAAA